MLGFALQHTVTMKFQVPCISMIWTLPTPSLVDVEELVFAIVERDTLAFLVSCFGESCPLAVVCVVFLSMYYIRLF
jgi:hypothetical protein